VAWRSAARVGHPQSSSARWIKIHYAGFVSFEFEKDPGDPLPGLAESVGYVRGVLAVI